MHNSEIRIVLTLCEALRDKYKAEPHTPCQAWASLCSQAADSLKSPAPWCLFTQLPLRFWRTCAKAWHVLGAEPLGQSESNT